MQQGFTGGAVKKLQLRLIDAGLLLDGADGDFGIQTHLAVQRFQKNNGLEADGIVGAATLAILYPEDKLTPSTEPFSIPEELSTSIISGGSFTWAEATHGGSRIPQEREIYDGIIRIATEAQKARDLIKQPFVITSWYRPPSANAAAGGVLDSRHLCGDALDFWVETLNGDELYELLDPWWAGGLGRYSNHPALCHLDARGYLARWGH